MSRLLCQCLSTATTTRAEAARATMPQADSTNTNKEEGDSVGPGLPRHRTMEIYQDQTTFKIELEGSLANVRALWLVS